MFDVGIVQLGEALGCSHQYASKLVHQLEDAGLIQRIYTGNNLTHRVSRFFWLGPSDHAPAQGDSDRGADPAKRPVRPVARTLVLGHVVGPSSRTSRTLVKVTPAPREGPAQHFYLSPSAIEDVSDLDPTRLDSELDRRLARGD